MILAIFAASATTTLFVCALDSKPRSHFGSRYPRAVLDEVTADELAADVVEGRVVA